MRIRFELNRAPVELDAPPDETVLTLLRRRLGVLSVRETCGIGVCGACTALVDGEPISTCLLLAPLLEGRRVTTAEGLPDDHRVVQALSELHAVQCGFCTPGVALTAAALLDETPSPTDEDIRLALAGNLCRCGCYLKIAAAVRVAAHGTEGAE